MKHDFLHVEVYSVETIHPDRDLVSLKDGYECYGH